MEDHLSFTYMLPLKEIALRRVAINLWMEPDILALAAKFLTVDFENSRGFENSRDFEISRRWRGVVESKVKVKMSKLPLPKPLMEKVLLVIIPIGLQIKKWREFHKEFFSELQEECVVSILDKLCWTTAGKLDYIKTAQEIIHCEMVDIVKRYVLACSYCLDEYIPIFWEKLPRELQREFYNKKDTSQVERWKMEYCWPYILKGKHSQLEKIWKRTYYLPFSFYQYAFVNSACYGNIAATQYFFRKLTLAEKESGIVPTVVQATFYNRLQFGVLIVKKCYPSDHTSDILCYLLSLVNNEMQMKMFKKFHFQVLLCFLNWPWQDDFFKIAEIIWPFIPSEEYRCFLQTLFSYVADSNYCFPNVFPEFFKRSPVSFKKVFLDRQCLLFDFFFQFFLHKDSETIKAIFRSVDAADRKRLVFNRMAFISFCTFLSADNMHIVEVCLREAKLSLEDRERLKKVFLEFLKITKNDPIAKRREQWKCFLQIMNGIGTNVQSKRCLEDKTRNYAKKLCSDK